MKQSIKPKAITEIVLPEHQGISKRDFDVLKRWAEYYPERMTEEATAVVRPLTPIDPLNDTTKLLRGKKMKQYNISKLNGLSRGSHVKINIHAWIKHFEKHLGPVAITPPVGDNTKSEYPEVDVVDAYPKVIRL